jgi:hypothetical protein
VIVLVIWFAVVVPAIAIGTVMFIRNLHLKSVPGWAPWASEAGTLSWRDRFEVYRATSWGRAVSRPELAGAARLRCEAAIAAIEHANANAGSKWRLILALVIGLNGVFSLVRAVVENDVLALVLCPLLVGSAILLIPDVQRRLNERSVARLRRSAEANTHAHI